MPDAGFVLFFGSMTFAKPGALVRGDRLDEHKGASKWLKLLDLNTRTGFAAKIPALSRGCTRMGNSLLKSNAKYGFCPEAPAVAAARTSCLTGPCRRLTVRRFARGRLPAPCAARRARSWDLGMRPSGDPTVATQNR